MVNIANRQHNNRLAFKKHKAQNENYLLLETFVMAGNYLLRTFYSGQRFANETFFEYPAFRQNSSFRAVFCVLLISSETL
jgi:hypothetical protein